MRILPAAKVSISIMHSRTGDTTQDEFRDPLENEPDKIPTITLTSTKPLL